MTMVFSDICWTTCGFSFTPVMITSVIITPCGSNCSLSVRFMSDATSFPLAIAAVAAAADDGPATA